MSDIAVIWNITVISHANISAIFPLSNATLVGDLNYPPVSYGLSLLCLSHLALWVFDATFSYQDVHIMTFVLSVLANTWYRPVIVVATIFEFSDVSGNEVLLAVVSCGVPFMFPFAFISLIYLFWVSIWFCGSAFSVASPLQTVSASVADIITTTTLVLFMRDKRTGLKSMERLLDRLTVIIVNRALMTTILQLGQFITYRAFSPDVFVWIIFHSAAAKAYVNSLYALRFSGRRTMTMTSSSIMDVPLEELAHK
ncbi:hypothetical protein POSPLADRAFT_1036961 [Postia placenta MAD-698-R-SB12]|uniref:DUF6534 domain-containing protein n=1 Tax=Postia placenta MAD-698-R-SB12 TaxID=670580 RepID=A0A1X6MKT6_9APHY|nr:hypothetical protein POSPLADRAFT_1036961 [Postia placenta MAD-698-R-SB12]OSX57061.1 hypothetical protein POSPLADRAFT_1036961 [Postia placenta MAD-698-R-SB12]